MINLFEPYVPKEAKEAVLAVLNSRFIGQGPMVDQFEKDFCKFFSVFNAVAVNSGTSALETAYDIIDLQPGDEVITTPMTCSATNIMLLRRKVKIIWADILESTLCIDPVDVARKVTNKTKAVVQVHLGGIKADVGLPCNDRFDDGVPTPIPVVSDAAQAFGTFTGHFSCFSFQAIKHISTPDGGLIVCSDSNEAYKATLMRWFGIDRKEKIANNWQAYKNRKMTFDIRILGAKRHMNDLTAAMCIVGLNHHDRIMAHCRTLFELYRKLLEGIDGITLIDGPENKHWLCTVLVDRRDDFARLMFEANIDTNVVQVRNDLYDIFGGQRTDLPTLNRIEENYLSIPIGMHVSEDDVHYIVDTIRKGW